MLIFDIDGVIADIHCFCLEDIAEKADCYINEIYSGTHNLKVPGNRLTNEEIFKIAVNTTVKYVDKIQPHKGALSFLSAYYEYTNEPIRFLTARTSSNAKVVEATYKWLDKNLREHAIFRCPYYVHFASNKKEFLKNNSQFTGIVEDRFSTANEIDFLEKVFLVNREWNSKRKEKEHVIRINTLLDIWDYI